MIDKLINRKLLKLDCVRDEAANLLRELEGNRQVIVLSDPVDSTGRKMRCVEGSNPDWYSRLFQAHYNGIRGVKSRSNFKRHRALSYLKKLEKGIYYDFRIYNLLMDEVKDRIFNGYYIEEFGVHVPPQLDEAKFMKGIKCKK